MNRGLRAERRAAKARRAGKNQRKDQRERPKEEKFEESAITKVLEKIKGRGKRSP